MNKVDFQRKRELEKTKTIALVYAQSNEYLKYASGNGIEIEQWDLWVHYSWMLPLMGWQKWGFRVTWRWWSYSKKAAIDLAKKNDEISRV